MNCPKCKRRMEEALATDRTEIVSGVVKEIPVKIIYTKECTWICSYCGTKIIQPEIINYYPQG